MASRPGAAFLALLAAAPAAAALRIRPAAPLRPAPSLAVPALPTSAPPPAAPPSLTAAPASPLPVGTPRLGALVAQPGPAAEAKTLGRAEASVRAAADRLPPAVRKARRRPAAEASAALSSLMDGTARRRPAFRAPVAAGALASSRLSGLSRRRGSAPSSGKAAAPGDPIGPEDGGKRSRPAAPGDPIGPEDSKTPRLSFLERLLFRRLGRLEASGRLKPLIDFLASTPLLDLVRTGLDAEAKAEAAYRIHLAAAGELTTGGWVPGREAAEGWEAMGERHMAALRGRFAPRGPEEPSLLAEPGFIQELEALSGARFEPGHSARPLVDGPASFAERDRLIRSARETIHLAAWAIYDDETGQGTADLLIAKRREGVKVRVLVDGQTSRLKNHGPVVLKRLEEAGVEVVRFRDPARPYDGLHVKALIVDGRAAVLGGMNVGDPYSHRGTGPKWRDTDVYLEGPAVSRLERLFADLFNEQARAHDLPYGLIEPPAPGPVPPGGARAMAVAQRPGGKEELILHQLKAVAGASRLVRVENAYFITFPSLRRALLEALARGVRVQILTNSLKSVDDPIVGVPILESLPELIEAGAEVYLKEGETLHSKFMTVDGLFASVTSFNLHPRSVRYELELAASTLDAGFTAELDAVFEADAARARRVRSAGELDIPRTWLTRLVRRWFYNQL